MSNNIDILLENKSIKKEFEIRDLDLSQVFTPTPDDLELENRKLKNLLEWVEKYSEYGSRKIMEAEGYEFPPIDFCISPDNDWFIFEKWMNGIPIRTNIKKLLPKGFSLKKPDDLNDEEVESELQKLEAFIEDTQFSIAFNDGIPPRLVYEYLLEEIGEDYEMLVEGAWNLDGCSGYCPECFQRPWCDSGCKSSWPEDDEAGEMFLIESIKRFVSASPVSLKILKICQEEEDKKFKEFEENRKEPEQKFDDISFDQDSDETDSDDSNDNGIPF